MADLGRQIARSRLPARLAYLAVLAAATLLGAAGPLEEDLASRVARMIRPELRAGDLVDALRNVALFSGWGLVWMVTAPPRRTIQTIANATLTGFLVSFGLETAQLLTPTRTPSVLDLLANTTGALVGAVATVVIVRQIHARRSEKSFVGVPAIVFAVGYGLATFGEALLPLFRQTTIPGVWGNPLGRFVAAWDAFSFRSIAVLPASEMLLYLPAGFLAVAALVESGDRYHRAAARVTAGGFLLAGLAELLHGFLALPIEIGPLIVHGWGVGLGAGLAALALPRFTRRSRGRQRPRAAYAFYGLAVLAWSLRPYLPETSLAVVRVKLALPWWIPLALDRMRTDVFTVVHASYSFLLYLPIGALLAVWPLRRAGPLGGILPGLYLATLAEFAQLFVAGRTLSITDVLLQCAGVCVGWVVVRRAGFGTYGEVLRRPSPA
jgi:VanZ family protein